MSRLLTIIIVAGVFLLFRWFYTSLESSRARYSGADERVEQTQSAPVLPGMPASLESSLQAAQRQGAEAMRTWMRSYRHHLRDPRLAAIELDYVVLVSRQDPAEAKRVFQEVQRRVPSSSPVFDRIKKLEKTFK